MFFKIQNKQDRLLGFSVKRQTKADCCWDSYLFRSHTLLKLSQLLACQTNKKSSLNLTGQLWKTMLGNSLQRLQTIRWPSFGEEYPINWTLRLILAPCNQLQRQTKTFIIHSNTISAELNDFSSRELLFFSGNKKDHRIFSVSQQHLCKFSWSDCAKNKEFRNVKIIKTYKWRAWIRYWWDHWWDHF